MKQITFFLVLASSMLVFAGIDAPVLVREASLWFDAADAATVKVDAKGTITTWTSKAGTVGAAKTVGQAPVRATMAGQSVLDFGAMGSGRDMRFARLTKIRTVFAVGRFAPSRFCHILCDVDGDKGTYNFHRGDDGTWASPEWSDLGRAWDGRNAIAEPTEEVMPSDRLMLAVLEMKVPSTASSLTQDRYFTERCGGRQLGEILAFDRVLTDAERKTVTDYLLAKWRIPNLPSQTGPNRIAWQLLRRDIDNWHRLPNKKTGEQAANRAACILPGDADPLVVALRRTRALVDDLAPQVDLKAESQQLAALAQQAAQVKVADIEARFALFEKVQAITRTATFKNPLLKGIDRLLFVGHEPPRFTDEWNWGAHMCDQYYGFHSTQNGTSKGDGLYLLENPFGEKPVLRNLLAGQKIVSGAWKGQTLDNCAILSPDVDWDGSRIAFAASRGVGKRDEWSDRTSYHVFTCKPDGSDVRMLTTGPWNEFDPCWMPNGRIVFTSERRGGYVRCSGDRPVPSYTLHSMFPDGTDIVRLSHHETNEWHPSVNKDGMIVYTRWDYVDRGAGQAHHAWTTYSDGRDPRELNGNTRLHANTTPKMEMNVRQIPGSSKYVATAAPHHGWAAGSLILIDPTVPDDGEMSAVRRITPEQAFPESEQITWRNKCSGSYATAWPLSEKYYICSYEGRANGLYPVKMNRKYGLAIVDVFGNKVPFFRIPGTTLLDPMPLAARTKPPVLQHRTLVGRPVDADGKRPAPLAEVPKFAEVGLVNVYDTRIPFPSNTVITALRVWQLYPKTAPLQQKPLLGADFRQLGRGCLGTVPVEKDGSAFFRMPAGIPFFLQALDARGIAIQNMRSDTYVQPGEQLLCSGCHEPKENVRRTARKALPLAMRRAPSTIKPAPDGACPFNYPYLLQPLLNAKCVRCHGENRAKKAPDLRAGDWRKNWCQLSTSFINLSEYTAYFSWDVRHRRGVSNWEFFEPAYTSPATQLAAAAPLRKMLEKGHHGVQLTPTEWERLILWMDSNAQFIAHDNKPEAQREGQLVPPLFE